MNKKNTRMLMKRGNNTPLLLFDVSPDTKINVHQIVSIKYFGYSPHLFIGSYAGIKMSNGDEHLIDATTAVNLFHLLGI